MRCIGEAGKTSRVVIHAGYQRAVGNCRALGFGCSQRKFSWPSNSVILTQNKASYSEGEFKHGMERISNDVLKENDGILCKLAGCDEDESCIGVCDCSESAKCEKG